MLKNRPANRKRILIVISESQDQGSNLHVRDVLTAAEFANVVIYPMDVSRLLTSLTATPMPSGRIRFHRAGNTSRTAR